MKAARGARSPVVRCLGRSNSRRRRCRYMLDTRLGRSFFHLLAPDIAPPPLVTAAMVARGGGLLDTTPMVDTLRKLAAARKPRTAKRASTRARTQTPDNGE